jgi:regulatory protein
VKPADDLDRAKTRALRYLETRDRSRREVELRLRRYGYDDDTAVEVVAWLEELGYVDDSRFSESYVREKIRVGWGARRIRSGLAASGVPTTVAAEALETAAEREAGVGGEPPGDEILVGMVRRRFAREWASDQTGAERRAAAFLQRRGHDWETIRRVVSSALTPDECDGP